MVADAMLGSLARKLRALGFDTAYYRSGDDRGLVDLAAREGRTILTSDRSLAQRAGSKGVGALLVAGRNDRERSRALARGALAAGITLGPGDPLCSLCGGDLDSVPKLEIAGKVPPSVERRHRLFFRCRSCGQLYWRGSHWKKLMALKRQLGAS